MASSLTPRLLVSDYMSFYTQALFKILLFTGSDLLFKLSRAYIEFFILLFIILYGEKEIFNLMWIWDVNKIEINKIVYMISKKPQFQHYYPLERTNEYTDKNHLWVLDILALLLEQRLARKCLQLNLWILKKVSTYIVLISLPILLMQWIFR